jgi:hypothetical protein
MVALGLLVYTQNKEVKSEATTAIVATTTQNTANANILSDLEYKDPSGLFVLSQPVGESFSPITQGDISKDVNKKMGIPGLLTFKVESYDDAKISPSNFFVDYNSCCSGFRYWYDATSKVWLAESFQSSEYTYDNGKPLPQKISILNLNDNNGVCKISHKMGANNFAVLKSGDEGTPDEYHYMIVLSNDKVLKFISPIGLFTDYSYYSEENRPSDKEINTLRAVLESLKLTGTKAVQTSCR